MKNSLKIITFFVISTILYSCSTASNISYYRNSKKEKTTKNDNRSIVSNLVPKSNLVGSYHEPNNPFKNLSTSVLNKTRENLINQKNYPAARVIEIELESRGIAIENKSSTGLETHSFNALLKSKEFLRNLNLDTRLIDDEIKNRAKTGITETVVSKKNSTTKDVSYGNSLEELTQSQEKAIKEKNYLLANTIEKQIVAFKNKPIPENLEKQKEEAIKNKDYLLADKLEKNIQKTKINTKSSNNNTTTSLSKIVKKGSNLRETTLLNILSDYKSATKNNNSNSNSIISFTSSNNGSKAKVTKHSTNVDKIKYRRSSLYTMMIQNTKREHSEIIKNTFGNETISQKFNDHNIGPYLIESNLIIDDQSKNIEKYLNTNDVAKKLVSKWFNRNEKGEFNMQLVAERGNYNATDLDVIIARNNERGEAILADAGEELIANTFVIVNDYKFTNKAKKAKKAGGFFKALGNIAEVAGVSNANLIGEGANLVTKASLNGYWVKTTSYLYKLVWDEETAATFYNNYWMDENNYDENKKQAFDNSNFLRLEYIGSQNARRGVAVSGFSKKSSGQLIKIATINATNKAISKLERRYDTFKTKTPIIGVGPVTAKIGLKEGLEKGDKFEVLEQVLDNNNKTVYKRVGVVSVNKNHIWDNTFKINDQNKTPFEYTTFKGKSKKFQVGMFLRQIN